MELYVAARTRPIILTPLASNSSLSFANAPSSVVQTGVKSAGWENRMVQLSPMNSWKSISPCVVRALKLGAVPHCLVSKTRNFRILKRERLTRRTQSQTRLLLRCKETAEEGLAEGRCRILPADAGSGRLGEGAQCPGVAREESSHCACRRGPIDAVVVSSGSCDAGESNELFLVASRSSAEAELYHAIAPTTGGPL